MLVTTVAIVHQLFSRTPVGEKPCAASKDCREEKCNRPRNDDSDHDPRRIVEVVSFMYDEEATIEE